LRNLIGLFTIFLDKFRKRVYSILMEKTQSKFGEVLTRLMTAAGMKPLEVSARLVVRGMPVIPQTVDNWCKGKSEPRASHVKALAEIFGVPVGELLSGGVTLASAFTTWTPEDNGEHRE